MGEEHAAFKAFARDPEQLRGLAIGQSEIVRTAHNSFAPVEAFAVDEKRASEKDDEVTRAQFGAQFGAALWRRLSSAQVYHFISYVPHEGKLYELDGLKGGPICLGEIDGGADGEHGDWLAAVRPVIQRRIGQYTSKEIRFNLMAVVANRRDRLVAAQARIEKERNMTVGKVQARSGKLPTPEELTKLADDHEEPPPMGEVDVDRRTVDELLIALAHVTRKSAKAQEAIDAEDARVAQWRHENARAAATTMRALRRRLPQKARRARRPDAENRRGEEEAATGAR